MNIDFNILWFEDNLSWYRATSKDIGNYIRQHNFEPIFDMYRTDEIEFSSIEANKYDLILMDYKLLSTTGDEIIKKIRQNEILTDIVFYSSDFKGMQEKIIKNDYLLDGVYYTDRKDEFFNPKVFGVLNKIISKSEEIVNFRGIVMDNTCEFDANMKEILLVSYNKLDPDSKRILNSKTRKIVEEGENYYCNKCNDILKEDNILAIALKSKGYIIDSSKKSRLVKNLLDILKTKYKYQVDCNNFYDEYNDQIIKVRNTLGHVRQAKDKQEHLYVDSEGKTITITKEICSQTRNNILKYRKFFDNLLDFIVKELG